MRKVGVRGLLVAIGLMAGGEGVHAQNVVNVDCSSNPGALAAQFSGATPGGQANTTYHVTGPCDGNFGITQDNIVIGGVPGNGRSNQTINGSIDISGAANVSLGGLTINGHVTVENAASVRILPGTGGVEVPSFINNPGNLAINELILVTGPSKLTLNETSVHNDAGIGLHAQDGAVVQVLGGDIFASIIGGIVAERNSTVFVLLAFIEGSSNNNSLLVSQGSRALINSSTIQADTPFDASNPLAVMAAAGNSSVVLVGGNTITNSAAGGAAVIVSAGSTLEEKSVPHGFPPQQNDIVNGDGRVNTQSIIELGAAAGVGGITWNGNVVVSQLSSFSADGGNVTINGTLTLDQAANAFFNHSAGTSNSINHVTCASTTDHVSNPTLVTPNVMIGNHPPKCQPF